MLIFYQISISLYSLGVRFFSLFNPKAKLWVNGRKDVLNKIKEKINPNDSIIWFHCASLGEYEQARPITQYYKNNSTYKILVTFFSPSGYEIKKKDELLDYVFYLPTDTKSNAVNFIEVIQPKIVFFVKYEFWYFYINELKNKKIPTYLISGVFRENQLFFKWYGKWYLEVLKGFTHFFVQDIESEKLINKLGFSNVTLSGDTRFDRVYENSRAPKENILVKQFKNNQILIIGGSTWEYEEKILSTYSKANPQQKIIIAPHNIHENHLLEIENKFSNIIRYSNASIDTINSYNILLIDNIGMLSNIYQYSDIAFVGGGFTGALHNILEPAAFGNVVLFGNKHQKFHEAQKLIDSKGAFEVSDKNDISTIINQLVPQIKNYKENSFFFIKSNIGATNKVIQLLKTTV